MKKLISALLVLSMIVCLLPAGVFAAETEAELGFIKKVDVREEAPQGYIPIYNAADLKAIAYDPSGSYILMNDIVLGGEWTALCPEGFSGVLDGNGYSIKGLNTYYVPDGAEEAVYMGLFARLSGANIRNLRVEGRLELYVPDRTYSRDYDGVYMGGIAARGYQSSIYNCVSNVTIISNEDVASTLAKSNAYGGIVGLMDEGSLSYCRNLGAIDAYTGCGGIAGIACGDMEVYACHNLAEIKGRFEVGGLFGETKYGVDISSCANEGKVLTRGGSGGGLVGVCTSRDTISDCLNTADTGHWGKEGGFFYNAGICYGDAAVYRTVNVGKSPFAAVHGGNKAESAVTVDCFWLEGNHKHLNFSGSAIPEDTLGMLTAAQMKDEKSFTNYDFPAVWTLTEDMDYPYPTALLDTEIENPYKKAYVENMSRAIEEDEYYEYVFIGTSHGGLAGILSDVYEEANLHVWNQGWNGINVINDFLSLDFTIDNDFDVLLADLLVASGGSETAGGLTADAVLGNYSDMITHLCNSVEGISALDEVVQNLEKAAKSKDSFSAANQELMKSTTELMKKDVSMNDVGNAFTLLGCVTDTVSAGADSIDELIGLYSLANAYAEAGTGYGSILLDIAAQSHNVESNTNKDGALRLAVNNYVADMDALVAGDPLVLYNKMGKTLTDLASTGANSILNICTAYGMLSTFAAGVRMGFGMGTFFGDQVTNMDAVAYYGTMMDMAGYFAKCTYNVVMDYKAEFNADKSFENATKLNAVSELYLRVQALACEYAYSYSMAIAEKSIFKYDEHYAAAAAVAEYQARIEKLLYEGDVITIDEKGGISGFIASCPVTVVVEDMDGTAVATLATGKESVSASRGDYYTVFGEDMDSKAGLYETDSQRIRIIGEGKGTMDLRLFNTEGGKLQTAYFYDDVPVSKGDEFTVGEGKLILNGTEEILPAAGTRAHSFTDVKGDEYFADSVQWAVDRNITTGTTLTTFSPYRTCTRAQILTFLWRAVGSPVSDGANPFADIKESDYFYNAALWAYGMGMVSGDKFEGSTPCTRADTVMYLWKNAGAPKTAPVNNFSDVPADADYAKAVAWALEKGVTTGTSATTFTPYQTCTRAQIVTFLYRAIG